MSQFLLWIGRVLLFLSAVSLVTMPLTQRLWTWDRFLHGGQDFELGVLMVLIFLSLVLVLSKQCKGYVDLQFAESPVLQSNEKKNRLVGIALLKATSAFRIEPVLCPSVDIDSIPIRI